MAKRSSAWAPAAQADLRRLDRDTAIRILDSPDSMRILGIDKRDQTY